ncbi:HesA/MoeB/ThiF family protein [Primorskyibacter flagellatus]|uniref:HesA/MoeB/ThiF family protein n=1 Tax=Primorskyibacter flagellatus TaxID=1387277 RepID=UPI003A95C33D
MLPVLLIAGVLWGIGAAMGAPYRLRWGMIGLLYLAVILAHFVLPAGNPVRMATGEDASGWLILAGFIVIVMIYRWALGLLRARARDEAPTSATERAGAFTETELERYARHIVLRELGGPGQRKLKDARVLVIGAGGLGAPVLQYLAAAGVGSIGVIDDDVVENANLQRQVIHRDKDIGRAKVFSAQEAMQTQNPAVQVRPYNRRLDDDIAGALIADHDVILDGTDNAETRYLVNRACVAAGKPLVSGALSQWEGQLSVFHPASDAPCYQCIFPKAAAPGLAPSCAEAGVLGPLPGVVGAMMAVEAVKLITGAGKALTGEMLIYDALWGETRKIALKRRADCPVCGQG